MFLESDVVVFYIITDPYRLSYNCEKDSQDHSSSKIAITLIRMLILYAVKLLFAVT